MLDGLLDSAGTAVASRAYRRAVRPRLLHRPECWPRLRAGARACARRFRSSRFRPSPRRQRGAGARGRRVLPRRWPRARCFAALRAGGSSGISKAPVARRRRRGGPPPGCRESTSGRRGLRLAAAAAANRRARRDRLAPASTAGPSAAEEKRARLETLEATERPPGPLTLRDAAPRDLDGIAGLERSRFRSPGSASISRSRSEAPCRFNRVAAPSAARSPVTSSVPTPAARFT